MPDLERQLRAYAEHLDAAAPDLDEVVGRARTRPAGSEMYVPLSPRWRSALLAMGAAIVVILVAVGGIAFFTRGDDSVTGTTAPPATTTTMADAGPPILRFELATEVPAFGPTEDVGLEAGPFIGPAGVVVIDGTFHMLRNSAGEDAVGNPTPTQVFYGTSPDGVTWTDPTGTPVLTLDAVPYMKESARGESLVVAPDGTWVLFFEAITEVTEDDQVIRAIGRATAPAPGGPWSIEPDPVFTAGDPGTWDELGVHQPTVVIADGRWLMYYVGTSTTGGTQIGRATSADGVSWERAAAPVVEADAQWERNNLTRPEVVRTAEGFVMLYGNRTSSNWGVATSRDGVDWSKFAGNPVLTTSDVPRSAIKSAAIVIDEDRYWLYIENGGSFFTTDIAILTRDLPISVE